MSAPNLLVESTTSAGQPKRGITSRGAMPEETISREEAISRIRSRMIELCENGKSACLVAAEKNILCRGFRRYSDEEIRSRYAPYLCGSERIQRSELERMANHWQLVRQQAEQTLLACDVQYRHFQVCGGWSDFSNEQLSVFCFELEGARPKVAGTNTLPNI